MSGLGILAIMIITFSYIAWRLWNCDENSLNQNENRLNENENENENKN